MRLCLSVAMLVLGTAAAGEPFRDHTDGMEAGPSGSAPEPDPGVLGLKGDAEYGAYLSSACKTCHQTDGGDDGIPSIVRWPERDFVLAMHAYKNKDRPNPVMQIMAGRLTAEEIAALAAYFATLKE